MKKTVKKVINFLLLVSIFVIEHGNAHGQKLPNTQQVSLRAPAHYKVDGRATEFNNIFQSFNKTTGIFYSIANDDNNLYVVIQATDLEIIRKIVLGGITLTFNPPGKKNDKSNLSITYPFFESKSQAVYLTLNNQKEKNELNKNGVKADSLMSVLNTQLSEKFKSISISGITQLKDSVISVYNVTGIKAAALFDQHINITYEIVVPLKYIKDVMANDGEINYNIKLNGGAAGSGPITTLQTSHGDILMFTKGGVNYTMPATADGLSLIYPTSFGAVYKLAQ